MEILIILAVGLVASAVVVPIVIAGTLIVYGAIEILRDLRRRHQP